VSGWSAGVWRSPDLAALDENSPAILLRARGRSSLQTLVTVVGMRWTIEACLEVGKSETGLDEYEVRHWPDWYRHIALSMVALAFLSVTRCRALAGGHKKTARRDG